MIPPELLFSLLAQREQIPFPAVFEVILMEIAFANIWNGADIMSEISNVVTQMNMQLRE